MLPVQTTLFPLCCGSIKHALMGASLHTPGLLTLVSNLATSCDLDVKGGVVSGLACLLTLLPDTRCSASETLC